MIVVAPVDGVSFLGARSSPHVAAFENRLVVAMYHAYPRLITSNNLSSAIVNFAGHVECVQINVTGYISTAVLVQASAKKDQFLKLLHDQSLD